MLNMQDSKTSTWIPREDCVVRTSVPLALGTRASFANYISSLVQAEDLVRWARRPEPEFRVVAGLPASPVKNRGILRVMVLQFLP